MNGHGGHSASTGSAACNHWAAVLQAAAGGQHVQLPIGSTHIQSSQPRWTDLGGGTLSLESRYVNNGALVASASHAVRDTAEGVEALMVHLTVEEPFRRQGVGSLLHRTAFAVFDQAGVVAARAEAGTEGRAAWLRTYEWDLAEPMNLGAARHAALAWPTTLPGPKQDEYLRAISARLPRSRRPRLRRAPAAYEVHARFGDSNAKEDRFIARVLLSTSPRQWYEIVAQLGLDGGAPFVAGPSWYGVRYLSGGTSVKQSDRRAFEQRHLRRSGTESNSAAG